MGLCRILVTVALLLTGTVRPVRTALSATGPWRANTLSVQARREFSELLRTHGGELCLSEAGEGVLLDRQGRPASAKLLQEWAARHGVRLPVPGGQVPAWADAMYPGDPVPRTPAAPAPAVLNAGGDHRDAAPAFPAVVERSAHRPSLEAIAHFLSRAPPAGQA